MESQPESKEVLSGCVGSMKKADTPLYFSWILPMHLDSRVHFLGVNRDSAAGYLLLSPEAISRPGVFGGDTLASSCDLSSVANGIWRPLVYM